MKLILVLLAVAFISLSGPPSNAQNRQTVVKQDQKGRLVTTIISAGKYGKATTAYLGSAYFGNTVWHQGSLIYRNQREITGQIAYNIASNLVYWRSNDSTEFTQALPDAFIVEDHRFISEQNKPLGVNQVGYYEILYDGKTKLLCKWTKQLKLIDRKSYSTQVAFDEMFDGEYILSKDLYIQKQGERPKFIIPNEYWLSWRLPNMGSELANFIASHELTDQILVEVLIQYDKRHYSSKESQ